MDISLGHWYLPTRHRLKKLVNFCESAIKSGISTPGFILVQEDEFYGSGFDYANFELPKNWHIITTKADGMGEKLKEQWPKIKEGEWFGWLVDDLTCVTPEWDKKLLAGLNGKNFVSAHDGGQNPHRMCVPVFSKALLNAVGYVYPPGFWHTYLDDVWEHLGRATGCWQINMDVVLQHNHSFKDHKLVDPDETELKSYSRMEEDRLAFERWKKYAMRGAVERIKALQNA